MSDHVRIALFDGAGAFASLGLNWLAQSFVLLAVGLIVARLLRRRGPAVQSIVYRTTLAAALVCPLATWGLARTGVSGWSVELPAVWSVAAAPEPRASVPDDVATPSAEATEPRSADGAHSAPDRPAAGPSSGAQAAGPEKPRAWPTEPRPPRRTQADPPLVSDLPATAPPLGPPAPVIRPFGFLAAAICVVWLVIGAILFGRLAVSWRKLARLRRSAALAEPATVGVCRRLALLVGVVSPEVKRSPYLSSPCLAGLRRPAVLLPEASLAMGLRDVLIHELAHLRRRDCHWNLLGRLAMTVGFCQPLLWVLVRRLRTTAEEVCDDYVVALGGDRGAYARGLVDIAELAACRCAAAGVGVVSFRSVLAQRVARIMDTSRSLSTRAGSLVLAVVIAGGLVGTTVVGLLGVGPRPATAAAEPKTEPAAATNAARNVSQSPSRDHSPSPNRDREGAVLGTDGTPPLPHGRGSEFYGRGSESSGQPVSMSAAEFGRLSAKEQRELLVRVFKDRMKYANNFYYEEQWTIKDYKNENGKPGELAKYHFRDRKRHLRTGDSFLIDSDRYDSNDATEPSSHNAAGVNAEEGLGRNVHVYKDKKQQSRGQVQYFHQWAGDSDYFSWLGDQHSPESFRGPEGCLFPFLLSHKADLQINAALGNDKVLVSIGKPDSPDEAAQKWVYVLDPRKGFLPVSGEKLHHSASTAARAFWFTERFEVTESRLVDDLWMPTKITTRINSSSRPKLIQVQETEVSRIEFGKMSLADIRVPFPAGVHVDDTVEQVKYVTDAEGRPAGPVEFNHIWGEATKEWRDRYGAAYERNRDRYTMSSRLTAADRQMLRDKERQKQDRQKPLSDLLALLRAKPAVSENERIDAAIKILRAYRIDEQEVVWASAIRELITIGPPAVPKLIEELDRTDKPLTLRALGFVLRGIGDRRAVPALIRAIPRLLVPPSSDFGWIVKGDPELHRFMQEHDNDNGDRGEHFGYGRPIREIMPALQKLTGQSHGWMELNYVSLADSPSRQRVQRQLYLKLARRWADWWAKHWQEFVENEADAQLDQNKRSLDEFEKSIPPSPAAGQADFPTGPNVTLGDGGGDFHVRSFDQSPGEAFRDFDGGRQPRPSAQLLKKSPGELSKDLLDWARREGVDLVNIRVKRPGTDKWYYSFQPIDMNVWRITNERYANLKDELRATKKLELPEPWQRPIAQIDETTGEYNGKLTASYLFITREGTCGTIQLQSPLSRKFTTYAASVADGGMHYQFIYEREPRE